MQEHFQRDDISLDQQVALKRAATRLAREFDGVYGAETIERFLHTSYDQFADTASVANFLPLLAERFAKQRLDALARVEGHTQDGKPVVLFLCVHNAGRSQMALGFFEHHAGEPGHRLVGRFGAGSRGEPRSDRGHGRARHRHLGRVPQALDRRDRARRRRGRLDGLR